MAAPKMTRVAGSASPESTIWIQSDPRFQVRPSTAVRRSSRDGAGAPRADGDAAPVRSTVSSSSP